MAKNQKSVEPDDGEDGEENGAGMIGTALAVGDSKPFTALLGPAFTHLGNYLGKRTQDWVDGLEERRAKNTRIHVEKVKTVEHIPDEGQDPTERQAHLLIDWVAQAQKVDPEKEDDLAALWQGILSGIYRNEADTEELITILNQMNRTDARALLDLGSERWLSRNALDGTRVVHFERLGILARYGWVDASNELSRLPAAIMMTMTFAFVMHAWAALDNNSRPGLTEALAPLGYAAFGSVLIFAAMLITRRAGTFRLTNLGRKLRKSGLNYWNPPT